MSESSLLDLPDELVIRCLAGAGGMGLGSASAACTRLQGLAHRLRQLPVFSSALSTRPSLQHAITDAGQRALSASFGAVDFAVLFVANYGSARGKKYSDPTDLGHAVEMLREVLGQDVVIVGCACAGLMGVGPDSLPVEVDPLCNTSRGRAAAAAHKKAGLQPPPTKGVAVLLGKLPPGCVARAFAQETLEGPSAPQGPDSPPTSWTWPCIDEALALTTSQRTALAQQLQEQQPTHPAGPASMRPAGSNSHHPGSSSDGLRAVQHPDIPHGTPIASSGGCGPVDGSPVSAAVGAGGGGSQQAAAAAAAAELGASPETAAAAEGLLSVVAAAAAAAVAEQPQGEEAGAGSGCGEVELVPRLCLLLYDNSLQSFGYTESPDMERALQYMAARDVLVLGGASSGAADIFFSPGAEGRRVLVGEPPASPNIVGLMLCTAKAPAAAAAPNQQSAPAAAAPAGPSDAAALPPAAAATTTTETAAGGAEQPAIGGAGASQQNTTGTAGNAPLFVDSSAALQAVTFAALGLGPSEPRAPLFTNLAAKLASSHALSVNHIAVQLKVDGCSIAALPEPLQQSVTSTADASAGTSTCKSQGSDTPGPSHASAAPAAAAAAAGGDPPAQPSSSTAALAAAPARRSARLQAGAAAQTAAGQTAVVSPLQRLHDAVVAACPVATFDDDDADDNGQYLAVWACPPGSQPAPFTGDEGQVAICELLACELHGSQGGANPTHNADSTTTSSSSEDGVEVTAAIHVSGYATLRDLLQKPQPGSILCCQVVGTKGPACAATLHRGLAKLLPMVHHRPTTSPTLPSPIASTATATAQGCSSSSSSAAAGTAAAVGAAGRAMQDCYDALARCAADSGARSGCQALTVCCCTGRGQQLYAEGADPAAFGQLCESQIVDGVCGGRVPFVGVYVSGELGPEVQHMALGWGRGKDGAVAVAEMQGYTSMVAAWGCLPGVA